MENIKRFATYIKPHKQYFYKSLGYNVLFAIFSPLSMLSLFPLIKVLFEEGERVLIKPEFPGISNINKEYLELYINYFMTHNMEERGAVYTLLITVSFVLSTFLLKNFFKYLATLQNTYLNNGILNDLRNEVYTKVINLPVSFFSASKRGDLISRMTGDIGTVQSTYSSVFLLFREPLIIVFTLMSMFLISWKLTVFVLLFIPISGYLISLLGKSIKRKSKTLYEENGRLVSKISETLSGIRVIKHFTSEDYFRKNFFNTTDTVRKLGNSITRRLSLASPLSEFLGILTISVVLIYGGYLVLVDGSLGGSDLITFMALAYQILTPAKAIAKANNKLHQGNAAFERVMHLLDAHNPQLDKDGAMDIDSFNKEITFENVSFKYEKEYVLKNFSLTIPKGKMIALVGESGSGKSTIANLVTRFYDVNEGSIKIDGVNINDLKLKSLRKLMGTVAQQSFLFNDTVTKNISLGNSGEGENQEEIFRAANIANAHNFISEMPESYDSAVGDDGDNVSGGQKQRIAIARAVYKNPPIMILDEATSALDTESEKVVQDALENMMKNRTSIVIAHRLSTIKNADLIVVMSKGEIVEKGSHEELLKQDGAYANLINLQSLK